MARRPGLRSEWVGALVWPNTNPRAIEVLMNLLLPTISAATAASACAGVASANILVNGDFESQPNWSAANTGDPGFSLMTGTQMPGWVIEPGHAVTVHNTL